MPVHGMPVHGMQNYCFSLLHMQICDVLVITSGSLIREQLESFFFFSKGKDDGNDKDNPRKQ